MSTFFQKKSPPHAVILPPGTRNAQEIKQIFIKSTINNSFARFGKDLFDLALCGGREPELEGAPTARAARATGTSARAAKATGATEAILVAVLGLLTLLEGVEAIGEGHHTVTAQRVVEHVLDVVTRDVAEDVLPLSQDVIDRDGQRSLLLTQELIGN